MLGLQRSMIFPRAYAEPLADGGASVPGLERLEVESEEGIVEAYFLPGDGVNAGAPGPAVVFAHGNAELIDYWTSDLEPYRRMGVSVLLPEFRGYGRSAGSPSQEAIHSDFVAFYDQLVARDDVDGARVVFHGRSLGGGAVCSLATERPPEAMILQSAFESVPKIARRYLVPRFLIRDPFDNLRAIGSLQPKLLVVHGRNDTIIPFSHGQSLAAAAQGARLVAYDAGHNDCPPRHQMDDYWSEVRRFVIEAGIIDGD